MAPRQRKPKSEHKKPGPPARPATAAMEPESRLCIWCPVSVHRRLRIHCVTEGTSVQVYLLELLRREGFYDER